MNPDDCHGGSGREADQGAARVTPADLRFARERALRAAVLLDAVRCLELEPGTRGDRAGLARQAWRWVRSRDVRAPFSFHNVCESLGLDPSRLRRRLLTRWLPQGMQEREVSRQQAAAGSRTPRRSAA
jgi:hypothetical protein